MCGDFGRRCLCQSYPRLPAEGELTTTSGFVTSVGGCAANVAVALRILGRDGGDRG